MAEPTNHQSKRLSISNDGSRSGVLERWSKVFDKSNLARPAPRTLPYRGSTETLESLELEDVSEEVPEEVLSKGGRRFSNSKCNHETTIPKPSRRRSKELIRPKTPGRSGLYSDSSINGRPKWQSSTKVAYQNKIDQEKRSNTAKLTLVNQETSKIQHERPLSRTKDITVDRAPKANRPSSSTSPKKLSSTLTNSSSSSELPPSPLTINRTPVNPVIPVKPVTGGEPITQDLARDLLTVVFGSALTSFNSDWRTQHINFLKNSSYGISFYKPGPCGVIACIQAFLMKYLLFCQESSVMTESVLEPLPSERQQALVSAITNIIWQAAMDTHYAIVPLPCGECKWNPRKDYRKDHFTERLTLFGFDNVKDLGKFIKRHLSFFENTSGNGCVIFLYSVILSRTIDKVKKDLSSPGCVLMGPSETCSQAMINLLLTGRAVNHTFNGDVEYNKAGKALPFPLKGIKTRSDVGFLSLNEHFKPDQYQVGSMLKTPKYPVWVVDSTGGRYSVVFCLNSELVNDWRLERRFNLYYYNGTTKYSSSMDEVITVDTRDVLDESEITEDTHPLDHCLRTKWPGAVIEWS